MKASVTRKFGTGKAEGQRLNDFRISLPRRVRRSSREIIEGFQRFEPGSRFQAGFVLNFSQQPM
jgi:hypothetical protein